MFSKLSHCERTIPLTGFGLFLCSLLLMVNYEWIFANGISDHKSVADKSRRNFNQNQVFIIARAHKKQSKGQTNAFIRSILAQTHKNLTLWIINGDDPSKKVFSKLVAGFKDDRVSSLRFSFTRPKDFFHSFGYHTTDLALRKLIKKSNPQEKNRFLLVTNSDNLYHSLFLETSLKMMDQDTCLVASNWISRFAIGEKNLPNQAQTVEFENGGIDLGCVVSSLLHIRKVYNDGPYFLKNEMAADWFFFEKIMNSFGTQCVKRTDQVLFIHQ